MEPCLDNAIALLKPSQEVIIKSVTEICHKIIKENVNDEILNILTSFLFHCNKHEDISDLVNKTCKKIIKSRIQDVSQQVLGEFVAQVLSVLTSQDREELITTLILPIKETDLEVYDGSRLKTNLFILGRVLNTEHRGDTTRSICEIWKQNADKYTDEILKPINNFILKSFYKEDALTPIMKTICENCVEKLLRNGIRVDRQLLLLDFLQNVLSFAIRNFQITLENVNCNEFYEHQFWLVIQKGIFDPQSFVRKQTMYLLKKWVCIADISSEQKLNIKFVQDIMFMVETLEENQIHVIRPTFKVFLKLVDQTSDNSELNLLTDTLHPSWLVCIFKRIFDHESKLVIVEGIDLLLNLNHDQMKVFSTQTGSTFITDEFIPALADSLSQFYDDSMEDVNETPKICIQVDHFVKAYFENCQSKEKFLQDILTQLLERHWPDVPMFYICLSLSNITTELNIPSWGITELHNLRNFLLKCKRLFSAFLYSALEHFLLKSLMKFCDIENVSVQDVIKCFVISDIPSMSTSLQLYTWLFGNMSKFKGSSSEVDAFTHVEKLLESYLNDQSSDLTENTTRVSILLNTIIYGNINQGKLEEAKYLFNKVASRLNTIVEKSATHLYLPKFKIIKATQVIASLFHNFPDSLAQLYTSYSKRFAQSLLLYLQTKIMIEEFTDDEIDILISALDSLVSGNVHHQQHHETLDSLLEMQRHFKHCFKDASNDCDLQRYIHIIKILKWCLKTSQSYNIGPNKVNMLDFADVDLTAVNSIVTNRNDKKLYEKYITQQWLILQHVDLSTLEETQAATLMEKTAEFTEIISEKNVYILVQGFRYISDTVCQTSNKDMTSFVTELTDAIKYFWKHLCQLQHSPHYWKIYENFVNAVFQRSLITTNNTTIISAINKIITSIVESAASKPKLMILPCQKLTEIMNTVKQSSEHLNALVQSFQSFIVQCLVFNPIKSKECLMQVNVQYLASNVLEGDIDSQFIAENCPSEATNILMLTTLLRYFDCGSSTDHTTICNIITELLELDGQITKKKSICHHNSIQHAVKDRIWQAVLLLSRYIPESKADEVFERILHHLKGDAQPSVRYLMEWSMICLLHRFPNNLAPLFERLRSNSNLKYSNESSITFSGLCSLVTVATCVGMRKSDGVAKNEYFLDLVNICMPWCMSQHFSIRLYALAAILAVRNHFDITGKLEYFLINFPMIPKCLEFADNSTGNVEKSWKKMKNNFMFFILDHIIDLSIETVYTDIPRLCASNFVDRNFYNSFTNAMNTQTKCQMLNERGTIQELEVGTWMPSGGKAKPEGSEEVLLSNDESSNYQKKFIPWLDSLLQCNDDHVKTKSNLILVASLIDKTSNLGGLTRTCEIFGAEAMVVKSITCTSDKMYQSLAVTAHKWLTMHEVKPWQLVSYLHKMKSRGYSCIGTEQTSNSVSLEKFSFPQKSVIVLGNEKEGIPMDVINELDACVEIPQQGIIRSLNVHVSGALTIWEYSKQNTLK